MLYKKWCCRQYNIKMIRIKYEGRKFNPEEALEILIQEGIVEHN